MKNITILIVIALIVLGIVLTLPGRNYDTQSVDSDLVKITVIRSKTVGGLFTRGKILIDIKTPGYYFVSFYPYMGTGSIPPSFSFALNEQGKLPHAGLGFENENPVYTVESEDFPYRLKPIEIFPMPQGMMLEITSGAHYWVFFLVFE